MCNFSVNYTGSIDPLIKKAQEAITSNGGTFDGNGQAGSFSVKGIEGTYAVELDFINFRISKKPFILPCKMIESKLREYLGK